MLFSKFGLVADLQHAISAQGFARPKPLQSQGVPVTCMCYAGSRKVGGVPILALPVLQAPALWHGSMEVTQDAAARAIARC